MYIKLFADNCRSPLIIVMRNFLCIPWKIRKNFSISNYFIWYGFEYTFFIVGISVFLIIDNFLWDSNFYCFHSLLSSIIHPEKSDLRICLHCIVHVHCIWPIFNMYNVPKIYNLHLYSMLVYNLVRPANSGIMISSLRNILTTLQISSTQRFS